LDFLNETPGIGRITQTACINGVDLGGGNIKMNCDSVDMAHNEVNIAVDPLNPKHLVAGSNDYELFFPGTSIVGRIIAAYYTSFDGGKTWLNGHLPLGGFTESGDPSLAFNLKLGLVHYAVLTADGGQKAGFADPSIQVNTSHDGGLTYGSPAVVTHGTGGRQLIVFNDKPFVTVDNNPNSPFYGRVYVSYTRFMFALFGHYLESPIFLSYSDDGGETFSVPKMISGNSNMCNNPFVMPRNVGTCNEDQFSSPLVGPDGTLYVAFENDEFEGQVSGFRSQYLIVRSADGGQTFQGPFQAVGPIFDGINDYPINISGLPTLSNSQFRVNSAGNLAIDPTSGPSLSRTHLFVSFSDNRNGDLTGSSSTATTNTDIFVVRSDDGGVSWTSPHPVLTGAASQNDQFFPWAVVDKNGIFRVDFSDRSYDPKNIEYGETLATSIDHGSTFSSVRVDTGLSNPNDSRWFTAGGLTQSKADFIGDYNGLDIGSDGIAHTAWTDIRVRAFDNPPAGTGHNTQDAVTATA
jgi:hypothetical protein